MEDKHRPAAERWLEKAIAQFAGPKDVKSTAKLFAFAYAAYVEGFHQGYLEAVDDDALSVSPRRLKP